MVVALLIAALLVSAAMSITSVALSHLSASKGLAMAAGAYYAAESGVELALYEMAGHGNGFEIDHLLTFPEQSQMALGIRQRATTYPTPGSGDGVVRSDVSLEDTLPAPNYNLLERGGVVSIDASVDQAESYLDDANPTTLATNISLEILPAARDDFTRRLEPGMTRITDLFVDRLFLGEDTIVLDTDPDYDPTSTTELTEVRLDFVSLRGDTTWAKGDPVYVDCDNSNSISAGDVRLNTAFISDICSDVYVPSLGQSLVEGSHCDASMGELRKEKPLASGRNWQFSSSPALFYTTNEFASIFSTLGDSCVPELFTTPISDIPLYNDVEIVTAVLLEESPGGGLRRRETHHIFKRDIESLGAGSAYDLNISIDPTLTRPIISLFSPVKDINYRVTSNGSNAYFSQPETILSTYGFSGQFRQAIEMTFERVATVPIFNYTVAF